MKISTVALLAVTAIVFAATAVRAEEPEPVGQYVPETAVVPVSLSAMRHEILVAGGEKSSLAQMENSVLHIDDNNRLVGLSN